MNIIKFDFFDPEIKKKKLDLDCDIYRTLFQSKFYDTDHEIMLHYKKNFISSKRKKINYLYTLPYCVDFEFIFKFYGIDKCNYKNFYLKYFNHWSIIHYKQILENYNIGYIYYYYKPDFEYNLNSMYKYCVKNNENILIKNSRQIFESKKKNDIDVNVEKPNKNETELLTDDIHKYINEHANKFNSLNELDNIDTFNNNTTEILNDEIKKFVNSKLEKKDKKKKKMHINFIFTVQDDYDTFLNNIRFILKYINENKSTIKYKIILLIDNQSNLNEEIQGLYIENSHYFTIENLNKMDKWETLRYVTCNIYQDKDICPPMRKNTIHLFCFSNIFIIEPIDLFVNTFLELDEIYIMSYYDYYKYNAKYCISIDFCIFNKNGIDLIKKSKNESNLSEVGRTEIDDNVYIYVTSFATIDNFLPFYHKKFHEIKLINKPHLLCHMNSIILHADDKIYKKYYYTVESELNKSKTIKIALLVHIGNHNLILNFHEKNNFLNEIKDIINQDTKKQIIFHIYFTLFKDKYEECVKKIENDFLHFNVQIHFIQVENRGADLGPFIKIYFEKLREIYFDYIIKYHTKTDVLWRRELARPFSTNIDKCIIILENNVEIGAICSGEFLMTNDMDENYYMKAFYKFYKINAENIDYKFVGGTMFMMKKTCLDDFFGKYNISIEREFKLLEENYGDHFMHSEITYAHCWERIISGLVVHSCDKIIFGM